MTGSFDVPRYLSRFEPQTVSHMFPDVLVLGSGAAGLRAALVAGERHLKVLIVTKDELCTSNSWHAQGGIQRPKVGRRHAPRHRKGTIIMKHIDQHYGCATANQAKMGKVFLFVALALLIGWGVWL